MAGRLETVVDIVVEHAVEIAAKFNNRRVYGGCGRGGGGGAFGGRHVGWLMPILSDFIVLRLKKSVRLKFDRVSI